MKISRFIYILTVFYGCVTINPPINHPDGDQSTTKIEKHIDTPRIMLDTKYGGYQTNNIILNARFEAESKNLTAERFAISTNPFKREFIFKRVDTGDDLKPKSANADFVRIYSNKDGKRKVPFSYSLKKALTSAKSDDGNCETTKYSFQCTSSTFMTADYSSESQYIYPSAIYNMEDFENGNYDEITKERNDVTLSIDMPAIGKSTFVTVSKPNIVTLREGVRSFFENFDNQKAGNTEFRYRIYESNSTLERQMKITAGGGISLGLFGGATSDNTSEEQLKEGHRYITVDVVKNIFTINSFPNESYLAKTRTDTPVVINSVTYGMRLLANIDVTNMETKSISSSNNSASFMAANGHLNLSSLMNTLKASTTINCYVVGGPINGKCSFTLEDFEAKIQEIVGGTNFTNARPIQYSLSDLQGNIYSIQSSVTDLTQKSCKADLAITNFEYLFLTGDDDKDDEDHVSITFTVLPSNKIVYDNKDVRPRIPEDNNPTWNDGSIVSVIPDNQSITTPIYKSNPKAKKIRVTVTKTKGDHWHMGYVFNLILSDGSKVLLSREDPIYNFGDGGGGLGRSKTWEFDIPWNGFSELEKKMQNAARKQKKKT